VRRAQHAVTSGAFRAEIAPVTVTGRKGDVVLADDERRARRRRQDPATEAAFRKDGTVTPANPRRSPTAPPRWC
jgi:acetyl-CoA C-acetyltransferase